MQIAYYDESGDDGYPAYSSEFFVLTAFYLHYLHWQDAFETVRDFRGFLRDEYDLPIKTEMHTRKFLLNKKPYRFMSISDDDRVDIIGQFCDLIAGLQAKVINVVIVKPRILIADYNVLDTAFKYSIQRIENDLNPRLNPNEKFMIITDPGRVGKMRKTSRKIQRINYIPSRFGPQPYRREIKSLIEDPLPKDSRESYFIQIADLIAYVVYLNGICETGFGRFSNRLVGLVSPADVSDWMNRLEPSLNLMASRDHQYGVVYHPK